MHVALRLELRARRATQKVHQQINIDSVVPDPNESDVARVEATVPRPRLPLHHPPRHDSAISPRAGRWRIWWRRDNSGSAIVVGCRHVTFLNRNRLLGLCASRAGQSPEPNTPCVGRITGMVDCKWNGGSRVSLGQKFELASGLMEITYDTGAKVILQGPVTYEVESNGGYLSVGKLTGKLEKKAEGGRRKAEATSTSSIPHPLPPFPSVIHTPTATVTDLGTEFGVEVDKRRGMTRRMSSAVRSHCVCLAMTRNPKTPRGSCMRGNPCRLNNPRVLRATGRG